MNPYPTKSIFKRIWDFIGVPFRLVFFKQEWLPPLGWTTLEEERFRALYPELKGRLLDIGSGPNGLVNQWGDGVGVDVFDWGGGTVVVQNSAELPFEDASFDTVSFVACLNHIPYREKALAEAHRLMRPDGKLIVTMIDPILGGIGHAIWWYGEDRQREGMAEGEVGGMWTKDIIRLSEEAGFALERHQKFLLRLNNLYVFRPIDK